MYEADWETLQAIDIMIIIGLIASFIHGYKQYKSNLPLNHVHHPRNKDIMSYGRPIGYSRLPGRRRSKFARTISSAKTGRPQW